MLLFLFGPLIVFLCLFVGGIAFLLAATGGPDQCDPGGTTPIVISRANADAFQRKWNAFDTALDNGSSATVSFNESEVSSRARRHIFENTDKLGDGFDGPRICLHDGYGEVAARMDMPGFLDVKMKMRGTAKITDELGIDIDDVDMGHLPAFVLNRFEAHGKFTDAHLQHHYVLTLREGAAQVDGTP